MSYVDFCKREIPEINSVETFRAARKLLRKYGLERLRGDLGAYVDDNGQLTTDINPPNVFARVVVGEQALPADVRDAQQYLGEDQDAFIAIENKPRGGAYAPLSSDGEVGAAMSSGHELLIPLELSWDWFNILTVGMVGDVNKRLVSCRKALERLTRMRDASIRYVSELPKQGFEGDVGLFFHCYPYCKVKAVHMHIVDVTQANENFSMNAYRNLELGDVITVLESDIEALQADREAARRDLHAAKDARRRKALYDLEPWPAEKPLARAMNRPTWGKGPVLNLMQTRA